MVEALIHHSGQSETMLRALFAEKINNPAKSLQKDPEEYLKLPPAKNLDSQGEDNGHEWNSKERAYFNMILKFCYQSIRITDLQNLWKKW